MTWRQIFSVLLAPVGHDFHEADGVVIVRDRATVDALPPAERRITILHQKPDEIAAILREDFADRASFVAEGSALVFRVHPRRLEAVLATIAKLDSPETRLHAFPANLAFPDQLPDLPVPDPLGLPPRPADGDDSFSTQVWIVEHVASSAVAKRLGRELSDAGSRVLPDRRSNALIVTAPASRLPRLEAIVRCLDDPRWILPPPATNAHPAPDDSPPTTLP